MLGNYNQAHPHADDLQGSRFLYGASATVRDVAASAYRFTGGGTSAPITAPASARKGGAASVSLTISNRGSIRENAVVVNFYASTDRFITTSDVYLGSCTYWMDPGFEGTFSRTVTIPAWLPTGYYYVGYVLDPSNAIPEASESNNGVGYVCRTYIY